VPVFTVPSGLVTVAARVTFCELALYVAVALAAAVVVVAALTVSVCELSLLGAKTSLGSV
jgi:hypothetical protein